MIEKSVANWTSGYVAEIDYTYGYYPELNPIHMAYALVHAGQRVEPSEPVRYLELGYGQGLSLNIHAAASLTQCWGTDFNPAQVAGAAAMARHSGAPLTLMDASFEELLGRPDLPRFDIVALHGVWSWISDENRQHIVKLLTHHLTPGGICYLSYNCTPGWSAAIPLRHLLSLHAKLAEGDSAGIVAKIDGALQFAQKMVASEALFFRNNPSVVARLQQIAGQNRHYLAHEYFNADWHPMPFSDVAQWLEDAKLGFGASAHLLDQIEGIHLSPDSIHMLAEQSHPVLRETMRDYLVNQQFRRDLFVKGPRRMSLSERHAKLLQLRFVLLQPVHSITLAVQGALGEARLQTSIYEPLLAALEQFDVRSRSETYCATPSLQELIAVVSQTAPEVNASQLVQAVTLLVGQGCVAVAQAVEVRVQVQQRCDRLNDWITARALENGEITYLASSVTGGGVAVTRFEQLFMNAAKQHLDDPYRQAHWVCSRLADQGQQLVKAGRPLAENYEVLSELTRQALEFAADRQSRLHRLGVRVSMTESA